MNVVIYGRGYPNPVEIQRSAFVRQIIQYLPDEIKIRVVAPVPFFLNHRRAKKNQIIPHERVEQLGRKQITVCHPRYPLLPRNLLRPVVAYLQFLFTVGALRRLQRREPIDLIHCNWVYPDGVAGALISRYLGIPYLITEHQSGIGFHLRVPFIRRQITAAYRHAKRVILVSETLTKVLSEVMPALGDYTVIHNGVDVRAYPLRSELRAPRKLVYLGNLIPGKGLQFLIPSLARLIREGYSLELDIYGRGSSLQTLQALAKAQGIADQISFKGVIAPDLIPKLLLDYDLLILPSLQESFGMVLIEAMATGMPVLSTLCGGPEIIVNPGVGELVEPGSSDALYEGFLRLKSRWSGFRPAQIRDYCAANFEISELSIRIAKVYHEVTGK